MSKIDPEPMDVDLEDNDPDPITASYPVFLNPALPLGRRLLVLQHPNRTDDSPRPPPTELRLKAQSGMVEVDVPLNYDSAYDRDKGLKWGRILQQSMAVKNGGSHGLAGGFGFGAVQQRGGAGRSRKGEIEEDDLLDWTEAVRQDKVLRTQTLGGQYPETDEVQYMVGVFHGKDLHLTPVSSLVHLRPQLHHLDATTQLERQAAATASKESAAANGSTSASGGAASGSGSGAAPRAIHMTIKTTSDGDSVTAETIADRLRFVQGEPWRKLRYTDENEEAAWDVYNDSLFLTPEAPAAAAAAEDTSEGDKPDTKDDTEEQQEKALEDSVPLFTATWDDDKLLEAVSGIKKPIPTPIIVAAAPTATTTTKTDAGSATTKQDVKIEAADEARKPARRTRGGAAAASRRGGRTKASGA